VSEKVYVTDAFVFDSRTGLLTEVIMGTKFSRVPKVVMRKILAEYAPGARHPPPQSDNIRERHRAESQPRDTPAAERSGKREPTQPNLTERVRELLSSVSGIEPVKINDKADLADLGVDSLMSMELEREIEGVFKFSPDRAELLEATTLEKLARYISNSLHGSSTASLNSAENQGSSSSSDESIFDTGSSGDSNSHASTPTKVSPSTCPGAPFIISACRNTADVPSLPEYPR
jgi:acyl carrier protein